MKYTKAGKEIEIFYLSEKDFFSQQFKDFVNSEGFSKFLHSENDVELFEKRIRRINLYRSYLDVKVLGATVNGRFVGQSCAFRSVVVANGVRREWWWSVDTFLLQECRGLGIGKALQEKFHQDLPNFSSAWYTPINGIIKEKCGAHGIFDIWFNYYPVSSCLTVFGDLCFRKVFKRPFPLRISIPFLYSGINSLFTDVTLKGYKVSEVEYEDLGNKESDFMEAALSNRGFHIERSLHFLKWKYRNLKAGYYMLRIENNSKTEAVVAFSKIYESKFDVVPIKCVAIYDLVISPESRLTVKQLLLYVAQWYKRRKESFDGFQMLEKISYLGRLNYPFHACKVLSTIEGNFKNAYLTLADQDMDQI